MRKTLTALTIILIYTVNLIGQGSTLNDSIATYFQEIKINSNLNKDLWDLDLYGPILIINPSTRQVFANRADTAGFLKQESAIYTCLLPSEINIANTAIDWSGQKWAMIMLPLSENKHERLDLMSHELFHRSQPFLGFDMKSPDNNHLDKKEGRVYLRLEMEALRQAMLSKNKNETVKHLTAAFIFRKYRYRLYPDASKSENLLELNEGLASYTGNVMSDRNESELILFLDNKLSESQKWPTFVRSFAYVTTPLYGIILRRTDKYWNKQIKKDTNLTDFFITAFKLLLPDDFTIEIISKEYGGEKILSEETDREQIIKQRIKAIRSKFIESPHLEIYFENMSISFDPRNIVPLEGHGSVYPTLRVSDNWGILTVTDGALIGSTWNKVTVSEPTGITPARVLGDGWILDINNGYIIEKNPTSGNYILKKQ